jgi:Fur family transcriptional regulator, peroxide stress response regulator
VTANLEQALSKLKTSGVRMTPQRYAILAYLLETKLHPTADEIYKSLEARFPSMSVATVYNNLKVFIESGLVRELTYGDSSSRFDADLSDHYHAVCEQCGTISDFDYRPLRETETACEAQTGYQVKGHRLEIYGICPRCSELMKV